MNYHPVFLNLKARKAVVVGGGRVAERKILSLIRAGADITVISPSLTASLLQEKERKTLRHVDRGYKSGDLKGSFLVIAATDSPALNSEIAREAPALVNVVDVPSECNFIAPSVVTRGPLTIAISTGGVSPAFAKTIRQELEKSYGPAIGRYLTFIRAVRKKALSCIDDRKKRERFLKELASPKVLQDLRTKGVKAVRQSIEKRLAKLSV